METLEKHPEWLFGGALLLLVGLYIFKRSAPPPDSNRLPVMPGPLAGQGSLPAYATQDELQKGMADLEAKMEARYAQGYPTPPDPDLAHTMAIDDNFI